MGEYAEMMYEQQSGIPYEKAIRKPPIKCSKCGRKLKNRKGLKNHMRDKHGDTE